MIGVMFLRGGDEVVEVRVDGNSISWRSTVYGASFFPLDTIDMPKDNVIKEFPDLKDVKNWRDIAVKRLKDYINSKPTEKAKVNYIVEELRKVGYTPHSYQVKGGRVTKWTGQE
jgi:hypothetical protein